MNISQPLVTVIIASYNHARYIEESILSVLNQQYQNIELIVIDDGSKDNSVEIIESLHKNHTFTFIYRENRGLSSTLNEGLALANGKYICQLGSDDIMLPDKTGKQVALMEAQQDIAVSGGNALVIDQDGCIINKRQKFPAYREISFDHLFAETGAGIYASSAMIRKTALDKEGGWNVDIPLEDMYMWFKLTSRGYRMVGLNDVLIYYRDHATNSFKNAGYMYQSLKKTLEPYRNHPLYDKVKRKHAQSYFIRASKGDRLTAKSILSDIPLKHWNLKIVRALLRLI